jgi:hypothetical protein
MNVSSRGVSERRAQQDEKVANASRTIPARVGRLDVELSGFGVHVRIKDVRRKHNLRVGVDPVVLWRKLEHELEDPVRVETCDKGRGVGEFGRESVRRTTTVVGRSPCRQASDRFRSAAAHNKQSTGQDATELLASPHEDDPVELPEVVEAGD